MIKLLLLLSLINLNQSDNFYDNYPELYRSDSCTISRITKAKKKLSIKYCETSENSNSYVVRYKIINNKYFKLNGDKIYLAADQEPEFNGNLCDFFKLNYIPPQEYYGHNPVVSIIFIIDQHGNILKKGLSRPDSENYFNEQAKSTLDMINNNGSFTPALIEGHPVAFMYAISIPYIAFRCEKINFLNNHP